MWAFAHIYSIQYRFIQNHIYISCYGKLTNKSYSRKPLKTPFKLSINVKKKSNNNVANLKSGFIGFWIAFNAATSTANTNHARKSCANTFFKDIFDSQRSQFFWWPQNHKPKLLNSVNYVICYPKQNFKLLKNLQSKSIILKHWKIMRTYQTIAKQHKFS